MRARACLRSFPALCGLLLWLLPAVGAQCSAGTYLTSGTAGACTNCAAGTYSTEVGAITACSSCAGGKYSTGLGMASSDACTDCAAFAWSLAGATACYNNTYPIFAIVTTTGAGTVRKMDLGTLAVSTVTTGISYAESATISQMGDYALVISTLTNRIFKVTLGSPSTKVVVAGSTYGNSDGIGTNARFKDPVDIKLSPDNSYALVADSSNHAIRKIDLLSGSVVRIAGTLTQGYAEGTWTNVAFSAPNGLAISSDGAFALITEYSGNRVRRLNLVNGASSLVAGSTNAAVGTSGSADGVGASAKFKNPYGVVISSDNTLGFVTDFGNQRIRMIVLATNTVSSLVTFSPSINPFYVAFTAMQDAFFVTGNSVRKIYRVAYPAGTYTAIAGSGAAAEVDNIGLLAQFNGPSGIEIWRCMIPGMGVDTNNAVCQRCSAGKYSNGVGLCVACASGKYSTALGIPSSGNCTSCGAGMYSTSTGATNSSACLACGAGTYSSGTGLTNSASCLTCAAGTYQTGIGVTDSASCLACAAGTYQTGVGITTSASCIACAAGTFASAGASACVACAAGTYGEGSACTPCPGHTTSLPGSKSVLSCTCLAGYSCTYTKTLTLTLFLNLTTAYTPNDASGLLNSPIMASVALAAGVPITNIKIGNISPIPSNRRSLTPSTHQVTVFLSSLTKQQEGALRSAGHEVTWADTVQVTRKKIKSI